MYLIFDTQKSYWVLKYLGHIQPPFMVPLLILTIFWIRFPRIIIILFANIDNLISSFPLPALLHPLDLLQCKLATVLVYLPSLFLILKEMPPGYHQ